MWGGFTWIVAVRHLRYGIAQTLLTVGVVAISVTLIIFIRSLIGGLQQRLIQTITGAIPLIVISQPEREPLTIEDLQGDSEEGPLYTGRIPRLQQQKRKIEDWRQWLPRLEDFSDQVTGVSPVVEGSGIISRGQKRESVLVTGVIPERHNSVVDIQSQLTTGRFYGMRTGDIVIGYLLAEEMDLILGDKVRITSSENVSDTFTVAGIFDTGFQGVDSNTVYMTLGNAQSLFRLERAVTSIGIKLSDVFAADEIAPRISLQMPYDVEPWTEENQQLLVALRSQTQTTTLILVFTTIAAGFGIASILITAVTSKLQEIGILKAIGATGKQIVGIFTLESTLMAVLGGLLGVMLGVALSIASYRYRLATNPTGRVRDVFPIDLSPELLIGAFLVAVLVGFFASLYPARRAARVNAIDVIRGL